MRGLKNGPAEGLISVWNFTRAGDTRGNGHTIVYNQCTEYNKMTVIDGNFAPRARMRGCHFRQRSCRNLQLAVEAAAAEASARPIVRWRSQSCPSNPPRALSQCGAGLSPNLCTTGRGWKICCELVERSPARRRLSTRTTPSTNSSQGMAIVVRFSDSAIGALSSRRSADAPAPVRGTNE